MAAPRNIKFICKDRLESPSIGIPVCVTDEALAATKFPADCRGGVIAEDISFTDDTGQSHIAFRVRHRNGDFVWDADELIEIGPDIQINIAAIEPQSTEDR